MAFNFNIKSVSALKSVKLERFFIFKFSRQIGNFFLALFIISLFFLALSFLGAGSEKTSFKFSSFLFAAFLLFFELRAFLELKIKNIKAEIKLSDAVLNLDSYNLASLFDIESIKIFEDAIKFCKRKKFSEINSTAILFSCAKINKDTELLLFRLGIDSAKLKDDLKNYLEKSARAPKTADNFSEDFKNTISESLKIASQRAKEFVSEKEILVALAKHDNFFKKVLIDYDLNSKDIENITLWLDSAETRAKKARQFWSKENLARQGSFGKDWVSGFTITLDQFSVDWRDEVSKYISKEIIGHKKELEETEIILARSSLSNVLIVGDPGTGRKSIVEGLAQKCYMGQSLPELNDKRVVELDMVALLSRIDNPEKVEATLDQIFQEVLSAGNVILVIDEFQNFIGKDAQKPGSIDVSNILSKYLALPNFQFVAITTFDGLHRKIEQNSSLVEYFRKIEVQEITEIETIRILQGLAIGLEKKYKILVLYPSIREIVNLTARYFPSTPFPKKAIDILDEAIIYTSTLKEKAVLPHHIAKIVSDKTQIPVGKMEFKEKEVLLNLENLIHQRIINQQEAVKEISIAMRRARAGIASKKRPMGSFLFLGPTGVGKTETAKALAQIYFTSEEKMIRIDMSEFQAISDIPRLIGAISPIEMQGLLTTPVRENPFSLVLLDEIEKAHPNILNLFLQVLDEGHVTDGQGRKVIFTNTIIICTSNAGANDIFKAVEAGEKLDKQKLLKKLFDKDIFRPEFINRFDAAIIFHPLTKENLLQIAQLTLASLQKNLKEKEIDFIISEPLKEKIVELSYKPEFGAREMRRVVQDKIENKIAEALISDKIKKGDQFELNPETFEIIVSSAA
jgi:ATP-dependent Clp protease ATP-binding subunit ClpC